jgi:3D (Asp-Asp-Asp) domain-containing protein
MKQSNFKKCVIGLTLSICLLTGSSLATAKTGNWQVEPLHMQQQNLIVIDTKYRTDLARKIKNMEKAVQVKPDVLKATIQAAKQTAKKKVAKPVQTKQSLHSKSLEMAEVTKNQDLAAAKMHSLKIPSGNTIKYSRLIPVKATAYTAAAEENGIWGAYDYYGNPLKVGTISVDPDVIPMGSSVFVTGYSFDGLPAKGMIAKATDQGSAVKGKRIDIFVPTSRADATKFGMQDVKVYLME